MTASGELAGRPERPSREPSLQQRWQVVFELAPMPIGVVQGEGLLLQLANPALREMLDETRLDGSDLEAMLREAMHRRDRVERTVTVPLRRPAGTPGALRHYQTSAARLSRDGEPIDEVLFFACDVTEQVETFSRSEEQAAQDAAILETMDEVVLVADTEGRIRHANRAALRLHALSAPDELAPQMRDAATSVRTLDGRPLGFDELPLTRAMCEGETVREQFVLQLPGRPEMFLYATAMPLRRHGSVIGGLVVGRDITELMQLDRLKDQFLSVAAHELKTPLTIIKSGVQTLGLLAETTKEAVRITLDRINRGTDRIDRVVSDLLDVSQLQLGRFVIHREPVDLRALVERAVARASSLSRSHRLVLRAGPPVSVSGDRVRLAQVVTNLLSNAVKYSPEGSDVEIEVSRRQNEAVVSVADHGVGIPRGRQPRLFDRFYRAHAGTPQDRGGTGLGLFLAKSFVASHGGRIWFESTEGAGSTFSFSLPC